MARTTDRHTFSRDGKGYEYPMAADKEIFGGSLVVLDASGNAEPGTTATGKIAVGKCAAYKDNTDGSATDVSVRVEPGVHQWVNSTGDPLTKANIGDTVYVEDDETVCATASGKSPAGIMVDIDSLGVWVKTEPPVALLTGLLSANNLGDVGSAATSATNLGLGTGDNVTFTDVTVSDDLVVTDDASIGGLATVAETLGVTGVTTPIGGIAGATAATIKPLATGVHTCGLPARDSGDGNNATPIVTEIYVAEIFVPCNMLVTGIQVLNGSVASDDWHRALIDADGDLIAASVTGAVTSSGTDAYQKVPFTGGAITLVGPATYYVAQICSGTTDRYNTHVFSPARAGKITGQSYEEIPGTNSIPAGFTTALGPIASLY